MTGRFRFRDERGLRASIGRHGPPTPKTPVIPGYTPEFVFGQERPAFYVNDETGEIRETPDYETWTGDWEVGVRP